MSNLVAVLDTVATARARFTDLVGRLTAAITRCVLAGSPKRKRQRQLHSGFIAGAYLIRQRAIFICGVVETFPLHQQIGTGPPPLHSDHA